MVGAAFVLSEKGIAYFYAPRRKGSLSRIVAPFGDELGPAVGPRSAWGLLKQAGKVILAFTVVLAEGQFAVEPNPGVTVRSMPMSALQWDVAWRKRVRDLLLYVGIGVAVALAIFLGSAYIGRSGDQVFRWVGLGANTLVVFGYTLVQYTAYFRRRKFWVLVSLFLCIHLLAFISVLETIVVWRLPWWAVITPAEFVAIGAALALMGYRPKQSR